MSEQRVTYAAQELLEEAMTATGDRAFELMSFVVFDGMKPDQLEDFALRLSGAVREVLRDYPAVNEFLIEPDHAAGSINYGLRFLAVDPDFIDEIADEILDKAVSLLAVRDQDASPNLEREDSILVLTK